MPVPNSTIFLRISSLLDLTEELLKVGCIVDCMCGVGFGKNWNFDSYENVF